MKQPPEVTAAHLRELAAAGPAAVLALTLPPVCVAVFGVETDPAVDKVILTRGGLADELVDRSGTLDDVGTELAEDLSMSLCEEWYESGRAFPDDEEGDVAVEVLGEHDQDHAARGFRDRPQVEAAIRNAVQPARLQEMADIIRHRFPHEAAVADELQAEVERRRRGIR